MRTLLILFLYSTISWSQEVEVTNLLTEKAPCTFEMTKEQLISNDLKFGCKEVANNEYFRVKNFKIKFRGYPTFSVKKTFLDTQFEKIVEELKHGDYVTFFDVKSLFSKNKNFNKHYKTLIVKIVD